MIAGKRLFGISNDIRGAERMIKDRPCIIISNHQSALDLFGLGELFPPNSSYLAKKQLLYAGPVGLCLYLSGAVFINRSSTSNAKKMLQSTAEEIQRRKLKVWIFPEGTRTVGNGIMPFKKGAFNLAVTAQIPIVPVVFKSYDDFYNPKKYIFGGKYVAEVLPFIETKGLCNEDVPKLCDDVRDIMINAFERLSTEKLQENNPNSYSKP